MYCLIIKVTQMTMLMMMLMKKEKEGEKVIDDAVVSLVKILLSCNPKTGILLKLRRQSELA